MSDIVKTDQENLINRLTSQVKILEVKCAVVDDLVESNKLLKERLEQTEQSKEALMKLVYQHLQTINSLTDENILLG